jgi:hypothetical protein
MERFFCKSKVTDYCHLYANGLNIKTDSSYLFLCRCKVTDYCHLFSKWVSGKTVDSISTSRVKTDRSVVIIKV